MNLTQFLEKYKVSNRPFQWSFLKEGRDELDRFIYEKVREERKRYMRRMLEIGLINLDELTPRMQKIMELRFIEGMDLESVGHEFGVTRERIRQLETKALEFLKTHEPMSI